MSLTRTDVDAQFLDGELVQASEPYEVDITAEVVEYDLHTRARTAYTTNRNFLAVAAPTSAQNAAQIKALTRQVNALWRLTVLPDLLEDAVID